MTFNASDPSHQLTNVLPFPARDTQSGNTAIFSVKHYVNVGDVSNRSFEETTDAKSGKKSMNDPSREEVAALIRESEARSETKLARLEGKIDTLTATLSGKIETVSKDIDFLRIASERSDQINRETKSYLSKLIITTAISSVFALAGFIVALATYGDALFGRGMDVRDVVRAVAQELAVTKKTEPSAPQAPPKTMNSSETRKIPEKD